MSAAKQGGPGTIKKEWIRSMDRDPIIFALANPIPEIWPSEAREAGARIVATGRGDFPPNQINNSLIFPPGVFRGVLDARAKGVNFKVMVAASYELADYVKEPTEEKIVPTMEEWEIYPRVASAVAYETASQGLARRSGSKEHFLKVATEMIENNRRVYERMLSEGLIKPPLPGTVRK